MNVLVILVNMATAQMASTVTLVDVMKVMTEISVIMVGTYFSVVSVD